MTLKIEAGKRYRTRGGDEVEILKTDVRDEHPVVGVITRSDGSQSVRGWCEGGYFYSCSYNHHLDLISEIKPKRVVWLNVYEGDTCACFFPSRREADDDDRKYGTVNGIRIACIRVEFEESQFDE